MSSVFTSLPFLFATYRPAVRYDRLFIITGQRYRPASCYFRYTFLYRCRPAVLYCRSYNVTSRSLVPASRHGRSLTGRDAVFLLQAAITYRCPSALTGRPSIITGRPVSQFSNITTWPSTITKRPLAVTNYIHRYELRQYRLETFWRIALLGRENGLTDLLVVKGKFCIMMTARSRRLNNV